MSKPLRGRERFFLAHPPPRAIIPDACLLGTFENQDTRNGKTQYIQTISRKNRGLWTVYLWCYLTAGFIIIFVWWTENLSHCLTLMSGFRSFKIILWKGSKLKINKTKKNLNSVWDLSDKQRLIVLFTTGPPHCACNWLLFYSKCIGFTVCLTYSDVLLSFFINKPLIKVELPYLWYIVVLLPWRRVFQRFWRILSLPFTVPDLYGLDCIEGWFTRY